MDDVFVRMMFEVRNEESEDQPLLDIVEKGIGDCMCKGPVAGVWIKKRQVSLRWSKGGRGR